MLPTGTAGAAEGQGEVGEAKNSGDVMADLGTKIEKLLTSHETLLRSQDTLLGGYNALNGTIKAIIEADAKKNFLTEDLRKNLLSALDDSDRSLMEYLQTIQKAREF